MAQPALGGIAATKKFVLFGDRDFDNLQDVFRCLDADTGEIRWEISRLAIGNLDYGNSPRSTPVIDGPRVYFTGAHGLVVCALLESGEVLWELDLNEYEPQGELAWGFCGTPLLVEGKLILAPGGKDASVLAVDALTGRELWRSPGNGPSHGSFIQAGPHGRKQIIGHDAVGLGGWDIDSGRRLWELKPLAPGDFNVATPIAFGNRLLVATENNGTRVFNFKPDGTIDAGSEIVSSRLRPSMSTPVVIGSRLYCVNDLLYCLEIDDGLKESWRLRDRALGEYGAIVASDDQILVVGNGEMLLLGTDGDRKILSRLEVFPERVAVYSHPAFCGKRIYLRGESKLVCLEFP